MSRWLLSVAVGGLAGCADRDESSSGGFLSECSEASDCPAGWVCPDGTAEGMGNIGFVCTPSCTDDAECREMLGRSDVECAYDFCIQICHSDDECPATQAECRGSHPSCAMYFSSGFCAQPEGFTCY